LVLGLGVLAGAELLLTAGRMAFMHPFEQTYFSYLPRRVVERSFERDYWGLAYRRGLEYLVARQPQGTIFIDATHHYRGRAGRYFISGYRSTGQPYPDSVGQEVYAVRADGITLLSIFQRPWAGSAAPPPKVTPAW
jgi:hypothetical protein